MSKLTKTFFYLKTTILLLLLASSYLAIGQNTRVNIQYTEQADLVVNELVFTNKTTVNQLIELVGEPTRKVDYSSGEVSYFYDEVGIVFFTKESLVKGLGINYNWDGDEKFPEQTFTGSLNLAEVEINTQTSSEIVAGIRGVEFLCPIPIMCASKDRKATTNCLVAFTENVITQVAFIVN